MVAACALATPFCWPALASAQTATVTLGSQRQYIRGFGGMSHAKWAGDLTVAERAVAFGNGDGQLGFTALRIPVTDGSPDSANVATAQAALAAGAIVFASPWNTGGGAMDPSQFAAYATHLNDFVSYMQAQGVNLYAIGVQNEPDLGSTSGWMSWTAALCHDFVLDYGATIATKLMSCESYHYDKSYYDPVLNDPVALENVQVIGTHIYGTSLSGYPYPLFDQNGAGEERWMTEHYIDTTDADSWPDALGVATELHHAMVDGQFNLYTWWYIVRSYGPIKPAGTVSKRGWCMAQFSKFIRPGFHRVDASAAPMAGVYLSAYTSGTEVVVVIVNTNTSSSSLDVTINGSNISSYDRFTTSGTKSLNPDGQVAASNGSLTVSLDAQSVTTLHGPSSSATGTGGTAGTNGAAGAGGAPGSAGSTGVAGATGTGGAAPASGAAGTAGVAGAGGMAGSGGSAGVDGATGTGGAGATGVAGAGGLTGSGGGVTTTGSAGQGGATGSGNTMGSSGATGASGEAGSTSATGATGGSTAGNSSGDTGCSCRLNSNRLGSPMFGSTFVALGTLCVRRRRRSAR